MISVSLLPREYRQLAQLRRKRAIILVVGCLIILALILTLRLLWISVGVTQKQLDSLAAQYQVLEEERETLAFYQSLYQDVVNRNRIIQAAAAKQLDWVFLLDNVGLQMPAGVRLTDFSLALSNQTNETKAEGTSGKKLKIMGEAQDHPSVGRLVEGLKSIPQFSDVTCDYSKIGGNGRIQFSISGNFLGGDP